MMCSGPFRGAQGHSNSQTRTEGRGHMDWKRGEVACRGNARSVHLWLKKTTLTKRL